MSLNISVSSLFSTSLESSVKFMSSGKPAGSIIAARGLAMQLVVRHCIVYSLFCILIIIIINKTAKEILNCL